MAGTKRSHRRVQYPPPRPVTAHAGLDNLAGRFPSAVRPQHLCALALLEGYGTGVAGDLLVHTDQRHDILLGIKSRPSRLRRSGASGAARTPQHAGRSRRRLLLWRAARVHALESGDEMPETYRIQGSKGFSSVTGSTLNLAPQNGKDNTPATTPAATRTRCESLSRGKWHQENDPKLARRPRCPETISFTGPDFDDVQAAPVDVLRGRTHPEAGGRGRGVPVTTRHWPATWRMSRTSGGARCPGTSVEDHQELN